MNLYPSIYASTSRDLTRFLVLDQLINVIGNGIRSASDFNEAIQKTPSSLTDPYPKKYAGKGSLYYAYANPPSKFGMIDLDSQIGNSLFSEEEREEYNTSNPNTYWVECPRARNWRVYPNFNPQFSWLHNTTNAELNLISTAWIHEFIWYYKHALRVLESGNTGRSERTSLKGKNLEDAILFVKGMLTRLNHHTLWR